MPPDKLLGQAALLRHHGDELLVIELHAELLRQLLPDLIAAGAELPADGHQDLGLAAPVQRDVGGLDRPLHLGLPLHKAQQPALAHAHEPLHHKAHQQRGEHRPLPDAHELVEVEERDEGGDHHHGAVEHGLAVADGLPRLFGQRHAHALAGGGQDVRGQVEHHAERHDRDGDQQEQQAHGIALRRGEEGEYRGRQRHQRAEQEGRHDLQQHGGLEVPAQDQKFRQDVEAVDRRRAYAEVQPPAGEGQRDLVHHVGQAGDGAYAQGGFYREHHAHRHAEQPNQVDQQPLGPAQ